jgi:hypothetical protein
VTLLLNCAVDSTVPVHVVCLIVIASSCKWLALTVTVHSQLPYTHSYRTLTVTVHSRLPYTHCYRTLTVTVHSLLPYTHGYRTLTVTVHSQLPYTHSYRTYLVLAAISYPSSFHYLKCGPGVICCFYETGLLYTRYTVHHIQYIIYSTSYTVHHIQYIIYSTSYTVHHIQYIIYSISLFYLATRTTIHSDPVTIQQAVRLSLPFQFAVSLRFNSRYLKMVPVDTRRT